MRLNSLVIKCTLENDDLFKIQSRKVLRHRTLVTNTLKYEFLPKRIEPTRFICFEVLEVPQLCWPWVRIEGFNEEFPRKKINSKDVDVDYGVMIDIPEDACS